MRRFFWLGCLLAGFVGVIYTSHAHPSSRPTSTPTQPGKMLTQTPKGYEFYAWKQARRWRWALLPGTNRIKKRKEITTGPDIQRGSWFRLSAHTPQQLTALLGRIPSGGDVFLPLHSILAPHIAVPTTLLRHLQATCKARSLHCHF